MKKEAKVNSKYFILISLLIVLLYAFFVIADGTTDINVVLNTPPDSSYDIDGNVNFNCTATAVAGDNTSIENISLYFNISTGGWGLNQTNTSTVTNATQYNFTITGLDDGTYTWACFAYSNGSYYNYSTNYTITIDSIDPTVGLTSPLNNIWSSTSSVTFNYTPTDTNLQNCTLYGNFSGNWLANETNGTDSSVWDIFTINVPDGEGYVWNVWCNDSAGNSAFNETNLTISVDATNPVITINYPTSGQNISSNTSLINITFYDATRGLVNTTINVTVNASEGGLSIYNITNMSCDNNIGINDTTNTTCTFTPTLPEGTIEVNATAKDGLGHWQNSSITFTVDITAPTTAPNITLVNDSNLDGNINITWASDPHAMMYGVFRANSNLTNATDATRLANVTKTEFIDNTTTHGTEYWYGVTSIDYAGNENLSIINTTTDTFINATANDTINPSITSKTNVSTSTKYAYLRWYNVTKDSAGNPDGFSLQYRIYVATPSATINISKTYVNDTGSGFSLSTTVSTNSTTYTASANGTHHFIITTLDDAGNWNNTIIPTQNYVNASLTVTSDDDGGGNGGGGGSGGGTPTTTGVSAAKLWNTFIAGTNTMTISKTAIAFTELVITSKNSKSSVEITVTKLDSKPTATTTPDDTVYQYLEITKENVLDSDVSKAEIKFKVEKSWLNTEGINEANIKLYRYSSNKWNALTTTKYNSDSNYAYYKATSTGLSYFVIAGKKPAAGVAEEVAEEEIAAEEALTAAEEAEKEVKEKEEIAEKPAKPWLVWLIIAIIVIVLLIGFFIYIKKQEEKLV